MNAQWFLCFVPLNILPFIENTKTATITMNSIEQNKQATAFVLAHSAITFWS